MFLSKLIQSAKCNASEFLIPRCANSIMLADTLFDCAKGKWLFQQLGSFAILFTAIRRASSLVRGHGGACDIKVTPLEYRH
jgi:hypothetical protein